MRKVILLAASSVIGMTLATTSAHAAPVASAQTQATNTCTDGFTWKVFGGRPFANSEEEGKRKLPLALSQMVAAGVLPQGAVKGVIDLVNKYPNGTPLDGNSEGHEITLTEGMKLNFMTGGGGCYTNVTIGFVKGPGRGTAVSPRATAYVFDYMGDRYILYKPYSCWNWSLVKLPRAPAPPPPPAQEVCAIIRAQIDEAQTDQSIYHRFYGPETMQGDCWDGYRYAGQKEWTPYKPCPDDCVDPALEVVDGIRVRFKGKTTVAPPPGVRWVEYRVSVAFANSDANLAVFCLEDQNGQISCGKKVKRHNYDGRWVSEIFRTKADHTKSGRRGQTLVWDWANCRTHWTH